MEIQVKDIIVKYSEEQQSLMDEIQQVILKNYDLISMSIYDDKILDISEYKTCFDDFFAAVVDATFGNVELNDKIHLDSYISTLYILYLNYFQDIPISDMIVFSNGLLSKDQVGTHIIYQWFHEHGTLEEFTEYLKVRDRDDEIFEWFQNEARWITYNYILDNTVNILETADSDFFPIMCQIYRNTLAHLDYENMEKHIQNDIQGSSYVEVEPLFHKFLESIHAPKEWFDLYEFLNNQHFIIPFEGNCNSSCYKDPVDGQTKIGYGNCKNDLGFINFVHEFAHYFFLSHSIRESKISITEIPAIFFEKLAAAFLVQNGYSEQIVDIATQERSGATSASCVAITFPFMDLVNYYNYGSVSREGVIAFRQQVSEVLFNSDHSEPEADDFSSAERLVKDADYYCDITIQSYLENGILALNGFQYLIGNTIVEQLFEKGIDSSVIEKMIYVASHLHEFNLQKIMEQFHIEIIDTVDPKVFEKKD